MKITRALYAALLVAVVTPGHAATPPASLEAKMDEAWQVTWNRFFHKDVQTFMDYLSSYEAGKEQAHLPKAEEVQRQYPNPCGYGTGMEDGMILGGAMLSLLCDRFAVTGEENLRNDAAQVFSGMRRCATVPGAPGFVARNICVEDRKSIYINSSRDQYTHFVHGLWKYYHSSLADDATKKEIGSILAAVAERMIKFVTPENNFDSCRADGQKCLVGISRMWNVQAHEAARLPMIYAAAWDTTRNERYREQWRQYAAEAVAQSANPDKNQPAYAFLQMQCSLELLHHLEPEPELKSSIATVMQHLSTIAEKRLSYITMKIGQKSPEEMQMLGPDWRQAKEWKKMKEYTNPQWGPYKDIWRFTREAGECAVIPMMAEPPELAAASKEQLEDLILKTDYLHNSSCGIIYHLASYWKARRYKVL